MSRNKLKFQLTILILTCASVEPLTAAEIPPNGINVSIPTRVSAGRYFKFVLHQNALKNGWCHISSTLGIAKYPGYVDRAENFKMSNGKASGKIMALNPGLAEVRIQCTANRTDSGSYIPGYSTLKQIYITK